MFNVVLNYILVGCPYIQDATKGCNIRKNCSLVLIVITSNVRDVLKLQQATGSLGRHLPEKIPDRSAGGGAEKGSNYVS